MGLLDGGALKSVFGAAFGPIFPDGLLHVPTVVPDGHGGTTTSYADVPVKALVEDYNDFKRVQLQIPATDVQITILQMGIAARPDADSEVSAAYPGTTNLNRYKVVPPIMQDAAGAAWTMQGRPISG